MLDPAPPPEAHRGVPVRRARRRDARGDGIDGRQGVRDDRLQERGNVRVPRRTGRRLLLHRGQLPAPGRASGVRARHRDRHRPRADPDRRRRAAGGDRTGDQVGARHRDPHQRRGSGARVSPGAGHRDALRRAPRARRSCRHRRLVRCGDPAVLRLDDREGDRRRRHAGRGDRPRRACAPRACRRGHPDDTRPRPRRPRLARSSEAASTRRPRSRTSRVACPRSCPA